ncbi:PREDICTED: proton-coupled folate transporter-like [Papilio xuthus]|uniref:Proton-coupled folate transporter-like n=1 Tax=Papilio xuthus TaxID=66420 RepID=A0AAJ6Z115_PAPXU
MSASTENINSSVDFTKSNIHLTGDRDETTWREKSKRVLKDIKYCIRETTVEPCLFTFMLCTALSSLAVQNMHLEKSCRVNFQYSDDICDRIRDRNTTGLENELNNVQSLVAKVVAWKFPLQTAIPAVMVLFIGAWSDKTKKRKIFILFPFIGEIVANIGLLLATYYFKELSLTATALIEALPAAFTGSYIIIFMGMFSFMADRTTIEERTFRLGVVTICVSLGTPTGTALSGILLKMLGYYGMFSLLLVLHTFSFLYGVFRLEDILPPDDKCAITSEANEKDKLKKMFKEVFMLVADTVLVALRPRAFGMRTQIISVIILYILMVGPLYGDSQVSYLYAIRKFNFNEVEFSIYGAVNTVLGLIGTFFCIAFLSKKLDVQDSIIGVMAGVSRIASCFVFAFAPNRQWYYSAPIFNIFSHTGLTAVRAIATKSVPTEEIAKLSSLMGVTEAIAPSIYMPTSSYIYVSTIENFPGAFYLFDASLTLFALALFTVIYILVKRRNQKEDTDPTRKEAYARTNEVSRF